MSSTANVVLIHKSPEEDSPPMPSNRNFVAPFLWSLIFLSPIPLQTSIAGPILDRPSTEEWGIPSRSQTHLLTPPSSGTISPPLVLAAGTPHEDDDDQDGGHQDSDGGHGNSGQGDSREIRFLSGPTDSPDPFSPSREECSLVCRTEVRLPPGSEDNDRDAWNYFIRVTWTLTHAGGTLREITGEKEASTTQRMRGRDFFPLDLTLKWDGRTATGGQAADGTYPFVVRAELFRVRTHRNRTQTEKIDEADRRSGTTTVRRDGVSPTIAILRPTNGDIVNQTSIVVTGSISGEAPILVTVNGVPATVANGTFSAAVPIIEGPNTLIARATAAGNLQAQHSISVTRDTAAPITRIEKPLAGSILADPALSIQVAFQDDHLDLTTFQAALDSVDISPRFTIAPTGASLIYSSQEGLSEGNHTLSVSIADRATNRGSATTSFSLHTPDPTLVLSTPQNSVTRESSALIEGAVTGRPPLTVSIADQTATVINGTFSISSGLVEGQNSLLARVTDAVGRTAEELVTIQRDSVAPQVFIGQPLTGSVLSQDRPPFAISYSDPSPGAGLELSSLLIRLDGEIISSQFQVGPAGATFAPTLRQSEGPHSMSAQITDMAGNRGEALSSFTINAVPELELTPRFQLDLDHPASTAPSDIAASNVIVPILTDSDEVVFLGPDGSVRRRIPLNDDPSRLKSAITSPGHEFVVIGDSVRPEVELEPEFIEAYEAGDIRRDFTLYDSVGNLRTTTSATDAFECQVSDGGTFLLRQGYTGEILVVNRSNGAKWNPQIIPNARGTTGAVAAISPDGEYVLVGAGEPTLDGKSGQELIATPRSIEEMRERSRTLGWLGLFTADGQKLWTKQLPEDGIVTGVAISSGAEVLLAVCTFEKYAAGGELQQSYHPGFLLSRDGEIIKASDRWGLGSHGAEAHTGLSAFILGSRNSRTTRIVKFDGTQKALKPVGKTAAIGTLYDVSKTSGASRWKATGTVIAKSVCLDHVCYLSYKDGNRLHLAVMDFAKRSLHASNISSYFNGSTNPTFQVPSTGETLEESQLTSDGDQYDRVTMSETVDGRFILIRVGKVLRVFDVQRI